MIHQKIFKISPITAYKEESLFPIIANENDLMVLTLTILEMFFEQKIK